MLPKKNKGTIITFYSYKGGTGRTMALSNIATILSVHENKKVLMIDWDLEAPGLHSFFANHLETKTENGLIDFFCAVTKVHNSKIPHFINSEFNSYLTKVKLSNNLFLLKAGSLDAGYNDKVQEFNWRFFFKSKFSFFENWIEYLQSNYDYVLIDSRTGLTDISGICTMIMPERVVTVFTPNSQSLDNLMGVVDSWVDYRMSSADFRPYMLYPLPSRIEISELDLYKKWQEKYISDFENKIKQLYKIEYCDLKSYFDLVALSYIPKYSYGEKISVLEDGISESENPKLNVKQYSELVKAIISDENIWTYAYLSSKNYKIALDRILEVQKSNLIELDLRGLELQSIPDSISKLTQLERLYLDENRLNEIKNLQTLNKLKKLTISKNDLTECNGLSSLIALQKLDVSQNQITKIEGLSTLQNLKELNISGNQITEIRGLDNLVSMKSLSISENKITEIKGLDNLRDLEHLSITHNQITQIKGLDNLRYLKYLSISHNQITQIKGLDNLGNLEFLSISDNQITEIKALIPFLKKSCEVNINENPIITPPVAVIKQGNDAILRFFDKAEKEGFDYIHEAKVTLVGEGQAGKTSLQLKLINPEVQLSKQDKRTRGIRIVDWHFKSKGRDNIAHIWDLGGQDVYYPVHRFFLTENSVFVLLASTRQTHHNFDYWIPTIYQFGGKSPIILGQTCHEGNKVSWNDLGYYIGNTDTFNIIKNQELPYYELNLTTKNEGLAKIKEAIIDQITALPYYGKGVPKSWVKVRENIAKESKSTACITFSQFKQICQNVSPESFTKLIEIEDFAKFLHSIGIILWYSEITELNNWLILQPEWVMNAVYKIIDDTDIQQRRGIILAKDFKRLWNEDCYQDMHDVLKKMLEVFKIAFPKKHKNEDYIIPARLLSMPNEERWKNDSPYLRLEYKYDFMPKGMVNQLSADLSRYIIADEQVWNNAVNFKDDSAQCQVEEDFYNRTLHIKATGKDARSLIKLVMNSLKYITDGYKGIKPQIFVPCTCFVCKTMSMPTYFLSDNLLRWSEKRENATVFCNESGTQLSIDELLYNVGLTNPHKEKNQKEKIFISYSQKDSNFKFTNGTTVDFIEGLKTHLKALNRLGIADTWSDKDILAGADWDADIKKQLADADIILFLISANLIATDYIWDEEMPLAKYHKENKNTAIVPVILNSCQWQDIPLFGEQNAVPHKGKPIASFNNVEEAYNEITEKIKALIKS